MPVSEVFFQILSLSLMLKLKAPPSTSEVFERSAWREPSDLCSPAGEGWSFDELKFPELQI